MISLNFVNDGTTVTVRGSVVYGTIFYPVRLNQKRVPTVDGVDYVYDNGTKITEGIIIFKNMSSSDAIALRNFITDTIIFEKNLFSITGVNANLNLGAGLGMSLNNVRFIGGNTLKDIFEPAPPQNFHVKFPYKYVG